MDDAVAVRIVERARDLTCDAHGFRHRQLPLAMQPVAQAFALDERHREPELAVGLAGIVDAEDVRVLQPRREADFLLEALAS